MPTLLLRLAAPIQSWGTDSKFERRLTENEPTKSGVLGMIAAALGRRRDEPLDDLNTLRFGVRVDKQGVLLRDFHTVQAVKSKTKTDSYITNRYYLSDAVFLAGLESDDTEFLSEIERALHKPIFPLYLGRRSCPPTLPIVLGIRDDSLKDALINEPIMVKKKTGDLVRLRYDAESGTEKKHDVPLSFDIRHRKYGYRYESEEMMLFDDNDSGHDAMSELEGEEDVSVKN